MYIDLVLYSLPWIYFSFLLPISHYLNYYSFKMNMVGQVILFFLNICAVFVLLHIHAHFRICLSGYTHTDTHTQLGCCCCSVAQSCPTLCNPMACSTPGFPVLNHLVELAQPRIHCIGDATQPSHPRSPSSPSAFNLS